MSLAIRSVVSIFVASIAIAWSSAPALAATDPTVKVDKVVDKTVTKFEKTVSSYDKKVDSLVAKTTAKVAKLVAKGKPAEDINEVVSKAIMQGMGFAGTTRAKIDSTETSGLRALEKYSAADNADEAATEIGTAADTCFTDIDEIWNAAGTALHALEVPVQ